ncbi:hypothetical protein PMAYCL1PPCAC_02466 [Pristionchus mayeri]|uniref:ENT domain-containing protein n=1 Tax=Pristionchus mayeri TaxID=1317129 RepID=A0AAN5C8H0_9BILA|nr:hypothetical protein PMAYCL1PPCAC_02466 [Pristionchus mayeri]
MTDIKEEPFQEPEEDYWENLDVNDCSYLLRTLEREAYTAVVNALRAKGPPSEHTFLLLDHLRSALSINDELGRAEIRRAAFDPKLCKLSNVLNPNYDTCTEWSGCSLESRGFVEAGPSRGKPFANTSSNSIADQLLRLATARNENINRSKGRSLELLSLPHKPFVPERLRLLLRETDRVEERIPPPLEIESPSSVVADGERKSRSEGRPPPAKKRRQRMSKGKKELPPELKKEKSPKPEEELLIHPSVLDTPSSSSTTVPPLTPVPSTTAVNASANSESAGSVIISPGRPPQSGDAMRTWVSKIHEKEVAASAAKRNGVIVSHDESSELSIPYTLSDDSAKKKRRPRTALQDLSSSNSCARTRPFQFDKDDKSGNKTERGNPDKRSSAKRTPPIGFGPAISVASVLAAAGPAGSSPSTPVARPETLAGYGVRNGLLTDSPSSTISTPAILAGYGSGGGKISTPIGAQARKGQVTPNATRTPGRYFVSNSGVVGSSSSSQAVKLPSASSGLGGRTASLGSQQLSSLHGISSGSPFTQKATASNSNSSVNSTSGGSTGSGIGASSSSSSHSVSALPLEVVGHDYTSASNADSSRSGPLVKGDTTGEVRQSPKLVPRPRLVNPPLRSPSHSLNGVPPSVSLHSTPTGTPSGALQRAASMSTFRARSGSRGASSGGVPSGERMATNMNEPVTDGMVQATVHNIMLEAAQKECANGKRATVLMRENGLLSRHSPVPVPSSQPVQQQPSYAVCRPSTSSDGTTTAASSTTSSGMTRDPAPPAPPAPPSPPPVNKTPILAALSTPPAVGSLTTGYAPILSQPPPSLSSSSSDTNRARGGMDSPHLGGGVSSSSSSTSFPHIPNSVPTADEMRQILLSLTPNIIGQEQRQQVVHNFNQIKPDIIPDPQLIPSGASTSAVNVATATALPRPAQRQYRLQPDGMNYTEFNVDTAQSYKSLASDGTPMQYSVSREELYDQGVLPRPSTSGMGLSEENRITQQPQASSHPFLLQHSHQAAATAAAQLGVPSSFSIPSISGTGGMDWIGGESEQQSSSDPPRTEKTEEKDILEQSCMELG